MFKGMHYLIKGFGILNQPGLRRFVVVPLLVNIVLFSVAAWLAVIYFDQAMNYLIPSWLDWLAFILWPLFAVCLLVCVFFSFALLANLVASPFYGELANRVEAWLKGEPVILVNHQTLLKRYADMLTLELKKLSYYLVRAIPLLLLSLIPGINFIAFPVWLIFSAWFLAYDAATYSLENHYCTFQNQIDQLRSQRWKMLSFGGLNLGMMATPLINVIVPAAAVAGMTALLYDEGLLEDSEHISATNTASA